jgi:hypothetical protein
MDILSGVYSLGQGVLPRDEVIDPGDKDILVTTHMRDEKRRLPAIVFERHHSDLVPLVGRCTSDVAVAQHRGNTIVAVGEDVGFDSDTLAGCPLDGKTAIVIRRDVFDHDAPSAVLRKRTRGQRLVVTARE